LRIYNNSNAPGVVVATVREIDTGNVLGKWTSPTIPAHASPQVSIATIEAALVTTASQTLVTRLAYNLEIESSFAGYVQYVLWANSAGVLANMTSCRDGLTATDSTLALNVQSSTATDYVSKLRVTNTGAVANTAVLTFADVSTGTTLGTWTSASIPVGAAIEVAVPDIEAAVPALAQAAKGGAAQYTVTLGNLSGYLQHAVENRRVGALTDLSGKCAIPASTTVTVPTSPAARASL
jgi:hypothetical protein